ncbi:hypothetical protein M432DRAFT_651955 [Thermoascus aurantiacus ATCC 26904]
MGIVYEGCIRLLGVSTVVRFFSLTRKMKADMAAPPPPTSLPRILRSRPRLLLQLQQIDHTARPEPVLDVVQTSGFGLRLDKIISAAFRGKGAVGHCHPRAGLNDSYARIEVIGHDSAKARKDGCNEDGEVIATICQAQEEARRNGKGKVILRFGPSWDASHHPNGRYEFVAANESVQNRIVEWMPCEKGSRSMSAASLPLGPVADQDKRFIFCVIDPITGHRSAIASMTRRSIDVIDRYSDVSRTRSNQFLRPDGAPSDTSEGNSAPGLNVKAIGDDLQLVLLITGICVALWEAHMRTRLIPDGNLSTGTSRIPFFIIFFNNGSLRRLGLSSWSGSLLAGFSTGYAQS